MSSTAHADSASTPRPARIRDRAATGLLIAVGLAVAAVMVPLLAAPVGGALQTAVQAAGFGRSAALEAEQHNQAAAIARLEQALGHVIGEVASIHVRGEDAARDDLALRERLAKLDTEVADLRANLPARTESADDQALRDGLVELNVSLARNGIEIDALRASIDAQSQDERHALHAVASRVDHLEALLAAREVTGTVRRAARTTVRPRVRAKPRRVRPLAAIPGWSVTHAEAGYAIVAGQDGTFDARPGHVIPSLGRVTEVRQADSTWIVVTEKGTIAQR